MDFVSMKNDFYRRFDACGGQVYQQSCGLLSTLLGFADITGALSITYPLSMGVKGICRGIPSETISVKSTSSDKTLVYRIKSENAFSDNKNNKIRVSGGQILIANDIPEYIDSAAEVSCCILKCAIKFNGIENGDEIFKEVLCGKNGDIKPYMALLKQRRGYCIKSDGLMTEMLPLPLTGFKIILFQLDKRNLKLKEMKGLENEIRNLRVRIPHMSTISEVNIDELEFLEPNISSKRVYNRLKHIINDNERIRGVVDELKRCRASELFDRMNASSEDFLDLWGLERNESLLLGTILEAEGVRAVRYWRGGALAVVYEERVDYVLSYVKNNLKNKGTENIRACVAQ